MENTKFIYTVNSDLDDELLYAEFDNKESAIEYAMDYLDKLPFVDEVELAYDADGIEDALSYTTIWDHTMAEVESADPEEADYWNMMVDQTEPNETDKYDIGDTTWFESLDNLVEDMEENEDMVECKECFELFPKSDCVKLAFGYICPTCSHGSEVADSDIFKIDFPEYEKFQTVGEDEYSSEPEFENDSVSEEPVNHEDPAGEPGDSGITPEEAVPFLVNDEVEAVAGYEKAAEVVADSDLENKEEILDTIDHIKEEEEEHIEELQDLMPGEENEIVEVENDPISDEAKEVEEEAVDVEEEPKTLTEAVLPDTAKGGKLEPVDFDTTEFGFKCGQEWLITKSNSNLLNNDQVKDSIIEILDIVCPDNMVNTPEEYLVRFYTHQFQKVTPGMLDLNSFIKFFKNAEKQLIEHIQDRAEPIESEQELEGTDNAVVDCKVADVVTHSEDEKPVDCKGEKKTLDKVLTEAFNITFRKQEDWDEFKRLCDEIGIVNMGDVERFAKENGANSSNILDVLRDYRAELGPDFKIVESLYNFTEEEMTEYNMDEDGNSLDSYDEYVRCGWCGEVFTKDQCDFEANLGWLCDRCYSAIRSRGERLTIIVNPTDDEIAATLTEAKKMTRDEMIAKEGTDDVDLINAGRPEEDRVELVEEAEVENEPISNDPGEKPSKPVKMANTASTSGMDFEAACQKYGVTLEGLTEDIDDEDLFAAIWPKTTELGVELLEDRFDKVVDAVTNATGVEISIVINTNNHVNNRWYKANRFEFAKFMLDPAGNSSEDEIEIAKELLIKKLDSMFGHYHYNLTINSEPNNNEVIVARSSESADKARHSTMN